jgi:hypothetical protein
MNDNIGGYAMILALVLTFMTTPVTLYLYPPHLRKRVTASGHDFSSVGTHSDVYGDSYH